RLRSWLYYASVGVIIALGGFSAEYLNEVPGEPSILNNYALAAFLAAGILGGLAYWLFAGRRAGGRRGDAPPPTEVTDEGGPVAHATWGALGSFVQEEPRRVGRARASLRAAIAYPP